MNGAYLALGFDKLSVWDILPVRTVSDENGNFLCCLWTVDIASNKPFTGLELDSRILLENIRERGLVHGVDIFFDWVRHDVKGLIATMMLSRDSTAVK